MDYQVWIKDEYGDLWKREDCGDLGAAKRKILEAAKSGLQAALTQELPFELQLKVGEPGAEGKHPKRKEEKKVEQGKEEDTQDEADQDPAVENQNP